MNASSSSATKGLKAIHTSIHRSNRGTKASKVSVPPTNVAIEIDAPDSPRLSQDEVEKINESKLSKMSQFIDGLEPMRKNFDKTKLKPGN